MKTLISTFLALALLTSISQAQLLRMGIKGGLNFSDVAVNGSISQGTLPSYNSATNYHLGGFCKVGLGFIGVQGELLISSKGGVSAATGSSSDLNLTYANVPILLVIKPIPILSFHAGPEFGFLLSAKEGGNDIKSTFQGSDMGIAVGAGVQLPFGLEGGLRYILGTTKVADLEVSNDIGEIIGNVDFKNQVFQVYVGWAFMK